MNKLEMITSDQRQTEMLERLKEIPGQLTQGEAINFFTRAQQVKLETMLEGDARHLGVACHQVTGVLRKDLVLEPELTGLESNRERWTSTDVGASRPASFDCCHLLPPSCSCCYLEI